MLMETNREYVIEKLDALNGAIASIRKQKADTAFAQSMHQWLVTRLEKERARLHSILPMVSAST